MAHDQFQKKLEDIMKWSEAKAREQNEVNKQITTLNHFYCQAPSTVKNELIHENGYFVERLHNIYLHEPQAMEASLSAVNSSGLINVANHWAGASRDAAEYKWSIAVIDDLSRNESISDELNSLKDVLSELWPHLVDHVAKIEKYLKVGQLDIPVVVGSIRNLYIKINAACFEILVKKDILNEDGKKRPMKILEEMLRHCGVENRDSELIEKFKLKLNDTFGKMSQDTKELTFKNDQEAKLSILKYLKDLSTFLKALDSRKF